MGAQDVLTDISKVRLQRLRHRLEYLIREIVSHTSQRLHRPTCLHVLAFEVVDAFRHIRGGCHREDVGLHLAHVLGYGIDHREVAIDRHVHDRVENC